jgi:hypothetical protein
MSREATDKVLGLAALEQAEYRAAHTSLPAASSPAAGGNSEGAVRKGSQAASSVPTWAPTDSDTADLLDLLAEEHPATPSEAAEWPYFLDVLKKVADENDGLIDQNLTRPLLRGQIRPARTGSFFHRAARRGLIRVEAWNESNDRQQRNTGKPTRIWRWMGATS